MLSMFIARGLLVFMAQFRLALLRRELLEKSQRVVSFPYVSEVCELEFVINEGVFPPRFFEGSSVFCSLFPFREGDQFLDLGTGCGVMAVLAALYGASRVTAVDINPAAVDNARENARLHRVDQVVDVYVSDVFSAVDPRCQFDTIYWNLPWIFVEAGYEFGSLLDPGYEALRIFLKDARKFMKASGRILLGFSDMGDVQLFETLVREYGFCIVSTRRRRSLSNEFEFILYELSARSKAS
jgi:release factor glutamine methyltransferase